MVTLRLSLPLFCLAAVLWLAAGCAPTPQALSPEEKAADLARLQQLKQELARLKNELAAAKARERVASSIPDAEKSGPGSLPGWQVRKKDQPLPEAYGHFATVIADKQQAAESLTRLLTLIETLSVDANRRLADRLLFIIPSLSAAGGSLALEDYDAKTALELVRDWPEVTPGTSGPLLLVQPATGKHPGSGRLLIDLEGLTAGEIQNLLTTLQSDVTNKQGDYSALLMTMLHFRVDRPAVVIYHKPDFSIGWRHD